MHHSKHGKVMMQDHTGEFPVLVFANGVRMPIIKLGGVELPFDFEPQSTKGMIVETRPHRLLERNSRNGLFQFTYIFQRPQNPSVCFHFDWLTLKKYVDTDMSAVYGVKFVSTMEQSVELWTELNNQGVWIKQDFERPATPEQCAKYYNNNKQLFKFL